MSRRVIRRIAAAGIVAVASSLARPALAQHAVADDLPYRSVLFGMAAASGRGMSVDPDAGARLDCVHGPLVVRASILSQRALVELAAAGSRAGLVINVTPSQVHVSVAPGAPPPRNCPQAGTTTAGSQPPPPARPSMTDAQARAAIRAGIHARSPTDVTVTRDAIDLALEHQASAFGRLRAVPEMTAGQPTGIRVFGLTPDNPLAMIGLRNGDVIQSVGGYDLSSPEHALEAYSRLREASELPIVVTRAGHSVTLDVHVAQ